jgi:phospholipase/carboxylesterase/glyoxalase family protein
VTFVHRYRAAASPSSPVLLLLHGTGGSEDDLVPLADRLLPGAGVLSPRGQVVERGMPRFFRRLAEGVFDLEDLRRRTADLADFVRESAAHYGFDAGRVVAVGFSNGANIASSLLLLAPGTLAGAVLFRGMVPIEPSPLPTLPATPVYLSNGRTDGLVSAAETERLVDLLGRAGAHVTLAWQPGGHGLTPADLDGAARWLRTAIPTPAI